MGELGGERLLGRYKLNLEDNIKMYLQEVRWETWSVLI